MKELKLQAQIQSSTTRRNFLKTVSAFSLGSVFLSGYALKPQKGIGLQLYTIRDDMKENPLAALKKVSEIGYTNLEAAGYSQGKFYGIEPDELKKRLSDMNMHLISTHTGIQSIRQDWERKLEASVKAGCKYVVVPSLPGNERTTIDSYKKRAEEFNKAGETSKKYGIEFGYHNHAFEFEAIEGQTPYDILLNETDKNLVTFQLDLYWAIKAGFQPLDLFRKYPGRFGLWHVKDMDSTPEKFFAEVGSGIIDFKSIFGQKKRSGMKYFFVEQDAVRNMKPMDAIRKSYQYLSQQKYV
jgi:sugar phosphate isomerase/epimerase